MTFTAVINACTTCKEWEIGLDLFNHLTEEIRNEIYLLAAIHECMVKNDQQEKADQYLKIMKEKVGDSFEVKFKTDILPA